MKRIFFLAATAFMLTSSFAYAGGDKNKGGKQTDCKHCTKQNCKGEKCADCCSKGKCVKG